MSVSIKAVVFVFLTIFFLFVVFHFANDNRTASLSFTSKYKVRVRNKLINVHGFDPCYKKQKVFSKADEFVNLLSDLGNFVNKTCINVTRDRTYIPVKVFLDTGSVVEMWRIIKMDNVKGGKLQRPNGAFCRYNHSVTNLNHTLT